MNFVRNCLGSVGFVASTMMIYTHLPWLLASNPHSLNSVEKQRGGREVWDGVTGVWKGGVATPGGGEERAKEPERSIYY